MTAIYSDSQQVEHRLESLRFAKLFDRSYAEASEEVQEVIEAMAAITNDPTADKDEVEAAVDTLVEALFPMGHNGAIGIEIGDLRDVQQDEHLDVLAEMDDEDASFAEQLTDAMAKAEITQEQLAIKIGVGQPAISMMLARRCRPQRKTVEKIADALKISPEVLWPPCSN